MGRPAGIKQVPSSSLNPATNGQAKQMILEMLAKDHTSTFLCKLAQFLQKQHIMVCMTGQTPVALVFAWELLLYAFDYQDLVPL